MTKGKRGRDLWASSFYEREKKSSPTADTSGHPHDKDDPFDVQAFDKIAKLLKDEQQEGMFRIEAWIAEITKSIGDISDRLAESAAQAAYEKDVVQRRKDAEIRARSIGNRG